MALVPFLACAAAWGASRLAALWPTPLVRGALLASLALPAAASGRLIWLRAQPGTIEEASAWLAKHGGGEPIFLSPIPSTGRGDSSLDLPLLRTPESLGRRGVRQVVLYGIWQRYQDRLRAGTLPDRDELYSIRWVLLRPRGIGKGKSGSNIKYLEHDPMAFFNDSGTEGLFVIEPYVQRTRHRTLTVLTGAINELGVQQARFTPDGPLWDTGLPMLCQDHDKDGGDWPHVTLRCFTARAVGPVVEVWRLDEERVDRARELSPLVFPDGPRTDEHGTE